jgi:WD40 repeat protein
MEQRLLYAEWAVSPDCRLAASFNNPEVIELGTGTRRVDLEGGGCPLAWSPDGKFIAGGGSESYTLRIWDAATGKRLCEGQGARRFLDVLRFSPDSKWVATGGTDKSVRLWDARTGEQLCYFRGHEHFVSDLAFSPDGRQLASAGLDGSVRVWETSADGGMPELAGFVFADIQDVAFASNGRCLLSSRATIGTPVHLWDVETGLLQRALEGDLAMTDGRAWYSADGNFVISLTGSERLVWNSITGQRLPEAAAPGPYYRPERSVQSGGCRAIRTEWETVIVNEKGQPLAWFPVLLENLTAAPLGLTWAGNRSQYVYIITLEPAA